jgi:outer membrane murein-binding lipoprotein Lpp
MNKKTVMFIALAISIVVSLAGCATSADLEEVSQSCKTLNQVTADKAAECCKKNREATDRLFQKLMKK